jgi:TolA-binding protein
MKKVLSITLCALMLCSGSFAQQQPEVSQKSDTHGEKQMPERVGQAPDEANQLRQKVRKLEALVSALSHENELLKKRVKELEAEHEKN